MTSDVTKDALFVKITPEAPMSALVHGGRAKCLQRLIRLDLPVPGTVAISFDGVRALASGKVDLAEDILAHLNAHQLCSARPSSESPDWGGPNAVLNIGMNDANYVLLSETLGAEAATQVYARFVRTFAVHVARLDPDIFDEFDDTSKQHLHQMLDLYAKELDEPFPQDCAAQLRAVLQSMARAWDGTTARLLRQAKGAPVDAGLGIVVQQMVLGLGEGLSGSGVVQCVNSKTGAITVEGRFLEQSQGREALSAVTKSYPIVSEVKDEPSLQSLAPDAAQHLLEAYQLIRRRLREEMEIEFTLNNGVLYLLDGVRVSRTTRAAVEIAVALANDEVIEPYEAVMRVDPKALPELLHRQIAPGAERVVIGQGIAASPGAAIGKIVFTAADAQAHAARDEACILVRHETTPEDIRGMHAAQGVLTERGGLTSHAAVIGRGIGLPCAVGVDNMVLNVKQGTLTGSDGRILKKGDIITIDGTTGQVLAGSPQVTEAALGNSFQTLMGWAAQYSDIAIRANADTPTDARTAQRFGAQGIGLCRTEHMFFEGDRLDLMREMIFARTSEDRISVLERLLPLQRGDFVELFEIMAGHPVCIRLFDPPLHEFLPSGRNQRLSLAQVLDIPISDVEARIEELSEHNPMLGMRGVRLGIAMPEIYEMQARAIFEAIIAAPKELSVVPEIMIPLVSAQREVELVKRRIDDVAAQLRNETKRDFTYRLGVMVETPRAALRAGDIARFSDFLSFGTNDLTQMTYGLSRDDAGRFMSEYVRSGVYSEDPFHTLDNEGVGELLILGAERGRMSRKDIVLSICGEHGGNPESIAFCRHHKFDYVSCSPFRVPLARLAAAQLAIADTKILR